VFFENIPYFSPSYFQIFSASMFLFDENGYLTPYEPILVDYETFVKSFVNNEYRALIFREYKDMLEALFTLSKSTFQQWINGSFVTLKPRPKDIDVVTFIDYQVYSEQEELLGEIRRKYSKVDAYFIKHYPMHHPMRFITDFDRVEWLHLFSTDRRRRPKGFIELNF
jgi:hypothetical protein